jgi:hypothetical protein
MKSIISDKILLADPAAREVPVKKVVTLVVGNIVALGFLVFLMNILSIAAIKAYNWTKPLQYAESHLLPNYQGAEWARKHFYEYDRLGKGGLAPTSLHR